MITHTFTAVLYGTPSQSIRGEIEGAADLSDAITIAADVIAQSGIESHRILLNVRVHQPVKNKPATR